MSSAVYLEFPHIDFALLESAGKLPSKGCERLDIVVERFKTSEASFDQIVELLERIYMTVYKIAYENEAYFMDINVILKDSCGYDPLENGYSNVLYPGDDSEIFNRITMKLIQCR